MESLITTVLTNIVPFLIILTVLVFVHELGHYWVAKKNGVKVEVFSICFGPELIGWTDKSGTRWKICLIPLGGYVKMFSDLNPASQPDQEKIQGMSQAEKNQSLFHKSVGQRMAVSVAGPVANYLYAIVILSILYIFQGQKQPDLEPRVGAVMAESMAEKAGFQAGDVIQSVNNQQVTSFADVQSAINAGGQDRLSFQVDRNGETLFLSVTRVADATKKNQPLGIAQGVKLEKTPFYRAPIDATMDCLRISWNTLKMLGQVITGEAKSGSLSGPIGIASIIGKAASQNWIELVWISAFLSISLGLINLFPIPMLDGGHLLFYLIEAIRGKPVSDRAQEIAFQIGFAIVISLMLYATWSDLSQLRFFEWISNLF